MNKKYIDAHCHLSENAPNVGAIFNATNPNDWTQILRAMAPEQNRYGAIGIHPWYINSAIDGWDETMQKMLCAYPALMVGEVGLDKHHPDMDRQIDVFTQQLQMAARFNRTLHLHCVGAWGKVLEILNARVGKLPPAIVAHGFSGDENQIQQMAEKYNMFFSYGPRQLNSGGRNITRIRNTPLDRILAETDSDNPNAVISVVEQIAQIIGLDSDTAADIIYNNTKRIIKNG